MSQPITAVPDLRSETCFFFTTVVMARRPWLGRLEAHGVVLSEMGALVLDAWHRVGHRRPWVSTGPFVVMPDHLHGLVWWPRTHQTSVSEVVGGFKEDASRAIRSRRLIDATQRLWQRSFIAREVRSISSFERTAEYIRQNPEKALANERVRSASRSPEGDR